MARVHQVRLQSELIEAGKRKTDRVTVTVPAVLFDPPILVSDVRNPGRAYGEEVDFYIHYIKANMEGTRSDILSYWIEEERKAKSELLNNPAMFKGNRDYFAKNPGLRVIGIIKQDDSISLLTGDSVVLGITLKKVKGEYKLAKSPNDLELVIVEASFW